MFWPYLICAYIVLSLLLGLLFHLAAWFDGPVSPKPAELVVFFVVFSMIGIPLVLATVLFTSFLPAIGNSLSEGLVTKEISQN